MYTSVSCELTVVFFFNKWGVSDGFVLFCLSCHLFIVHSVYVIYECSGVDIVLISEDILHLISS